jgi:hypothetical protein
MKKMVFANMKDLQKMMDLLEKHNLEYSWYFLNRRYEIHLGDTKLDHVKWLLREFEVQIPFKWGDYSW